MADTDYSIEIWKTIPFATDYAASSHGRVKRIVPDKLGRPMKVLSICPSGRYGKVGMTINGRSMHVSVHVAVAAAFHGPQPSPRHQAAHRDGQKRNNRPENLRWATPLENHADKQLHGTTARGVGHGRAKITAKEVRAIRKAAAAGETSWALSKRYPITPKTISDIASRKLWKHVP